MTWEEAVDKLYSKNKMKYKASVRMLRQLVFMDFEDLRINVDDIIEKTRAEKGRDTQRTAAMDTIITEYGGAKIQESQEKVQEEFLLIDEFTDKNELLNFFEAVKTEPYFMLINKLRDNGALSAFFGEQLKVINTDTHDKLGIQQELRAMHNILKVYLAANPYPNNMIEGLNNAEVTSLEIALEKYYSGKVQGPVNQFRKELLEKLIAGNKVTLEFVSEFINNLKTQGKHNWNEFSLISGLYYKVFDIASIEERYCNQIIEIFNQLELTKEFKFTKEFNLMGARQQGANFHALSFLKEKFKAGNNENQLSIQIEDDIFIFCYDAKQKEQKNITYIDLESDSLELDISNAFIYASDATIDAEHEDEINTVQNKSDNQIWLGKVANKEELLSMSNDNVYRIFFKEMKAGNLKEYESIEQLSENNNAFFNDNGNLKVNNRLALWQFANDIKVGDQILIALGYHEVLAVADVTGEYYYNEDDKSHNLPVKYNMNISGVVTERFTRKTLTNITDYKEYIENIFEQLVHPTEILFDVEEYLNDHKQLIIDGAPGTGKSYGVNTEVKENDINHERVTFYSDYEYHNFIGSILPKLNGETVTYEFVKGPFTKILNDALSQPEDKHYLIVEELTRGNAAAIFGDIFQLLDRTEEGWSEYPITHDNILGSLDPEVRTFLENEYEGKVVLPPNLSIICTINSSDQNVYPLDTAFKRRFDYKIESTNVHSDFVDYDIKFGTDITVSWQNFYQKLNKYILVDLGLKEDKQVGPYFIKNHKGDNRKLESIQTKLAMYMWNDLHKVHTISNKTIFKDIHTLYEVDNLFRTGTREEILKALSTEFKQHFKLNDSKERDE